MSKQKVMIVDDQLPARRMFELYLASSEKYELAFSVPSAATADIYLLKYPVDLILMDILMNDGSNGLEAAEKIKREYPQIKIIAVTSMPEHSWMKRAREIGVDSFWYKETDERSILDVIDRTMAGEHVYPDHAPEVKLGQASSQEFTERELEVLRIITTGATNAVVAEKLGISEHTVKTHVRNMLEKTGFGSRTELAIQARVIGLAITLEKAP